MRVLIGIAIGAIVAGMYFNPVETKQSIADAADWVKQQVQPSTLDQIEQKVVDTITE